MKKATHEQTKLHNLRVILHTIFNAGVISRADIARNTKLTPTTVSDLVEDLVAQRLVAEVGLGSSGGGKPPTLLTVPENARLAIGLDLSENEWRGSIINLRGKILRSSSVPSSNGVQPSADQVGALIDDLMTGIDPTIFLGIGIGSPGVISVPDGVIHKAVKYRWVDFPLRQILFDRYRVPVYIANDSHVAALAEYYYGQGGKDQSLVLLKVSDGISAGLILHGQIYYGDGYGAGEIGHICVEPNGLPCRCGHLGCLETVASQRAVAQMARDALQLPKGMKDELVLSRLVSELDANRDESRRIAARAGEYLGIAAANIVGLLNVHQIVLAGSVTCLGEALLSPMIEASHQKALDALVQQTQITITKLGIEIVQLGAAALVQQEIPGDILEERMSVIGVDIGGTKIASVLVDDNGAVQAEDYRSSDVEHGVSATLDRITESILALLTQGQPVSGIGIDTPGSVDPDRGIVRNAVNLGWEEVYLRDILTTRLPSPLPIYVQRDTYAQTIGESTFGAGKGKNDMVYLSLGSGLGAGALVDGRLLTGAGRSALEIGHLVLTGLQMPCACGNTGCAETILSGPGLVKTFQSERWRPDQSSVLMKQPDLTAHSILNAAQSGDRRAQLLVDDLGAYLGEILAELAMVLNPSLIVIGGGLGLAAYDQMIDPAMKELRKRSLAQNLHGLTINKSEIASPALGAAALVRYAGFAQKPREPERG